MATNRNITQNNDTHVSNDVETIQKRFELRKKPNSKVEKYRRIMATKSDDSPTWVQALEELIETHPKTKNL